MRRIFFAAGLFFDMSSTFSDSPDGRIAAALGLVGQPLLQFGIGHVTAELTCGVQLYELLLGWTSLVQDPPLQFEPGGSERPMRGRSSIPIQPKLVQRRCVEPPLRWPFVAWLVLGVAAEALASGEHEAIQVRFLECSPSLSPSPLRSVLVQAGVH